MTLQQCRAGQVQLGSIGMAWRGAACLALPTSQQVQQQQGSRKASKQAGGRQQQGRAFGVESVDLVCVPCCFFFSLWE